MEVPFHVSQTKAGQVESSWTSTPLSSNSAGASGELGDKIAVTMVKVPVTTFYDSDSSSCEEGSTNVANICTSPSTIVTDSAFQNDQIISVIPHHPCSALKDTRVKLIEDTIQPSSTIPAFESGFVPLHLSEEATSENQPQPGDPIPMYVFSNNAPSPGSQPQDLCVLPIPLPPQPAQYKSNIEFMPSLPMSRGKIWLAPDHKINELCLKTPQTQFKEPVIELSDSDETEETDLKISTVPQGTTMQNQVGDPVQIGSENSSGIRPECPTSLNYQCVNSITNSAGVALNKSLPTGQYQPTMTSCPEGFRPVRLRRPVLNTATSAGLNQGWGQNSTFVTEKTLLPSDIAVSKPDSYLDSLTTTPFAHQSTFVPFNQPNNFLPHKTFVFRPSIPVVQNSSIIDTKQILYTSQVFCYYQQSTYPHQAVCSVNPTNSFIDLTDDVDACVTEQTQVTKRQLTEVQNSDGTDSDIEIIDNQ